jgi:hypothetical protein
MEKLENTILQSFIKKMGKEVDGLDLIVAFSEDTWPDDDNIYQSIVMERQDNGKVWNVECTRNGRVKDIIEL